MKICKRVERFREETSIRLPHVLWRSITEPVVGENAARSERGGVVEGALDGEVPVRQRDAGVDRLQHLLEHELDPHVGGNKTGIIIPVIACGVSSWE